MDRHEYKRQNDQRDAERKAKLRQGAETKNFWQQIARWRPSWWELPSDRFAFFLVLFTAMLGIVGSAQWITMKDQLAEFRHQLEDTEIQEAASISIKNFIISGFPDRTVANFDIVNLGRTRADQINVSAVLDWRMAEKKKPFIVPIDPFADEPPLHIKFGFSLGPTDPPRHFSMYAVPIPPIQQGLRGKPSLPNPSGDDLASGRFYSFVYVLGTYQDIFTKTHRVSGCLAYYGVAFQECFPGPIEFY